MAYAHTVWRESVPHLVIWVCEPCETIVREPATETKH